MTARIVLKTLLSLALVIGLSACGPRPSQTPKEDATQPAVRPMFTIGWTSYVGWVPWEYAERSGIVKKWADFYGIQIQIVQYDDYLDSIALYSNGRIHGVTATLVDAMTGADRDSTVLIPGDYSNGNDGICSKTASSLKQLANEPIYLSESSVSHYLLERARELSGLAAEHPKVINTSDKEMVSTFYRSGVSHVATWNPHLESICSSRDTKLLFDSSRIPGEIMDVLLVDTETLAQTPVLADALLKIWFETIDLMLRQDLDGKRAREAMASLLGVSPESFDTQVKKTVFFRCTSDALAAMSSPQLRTTIGRLGAFAMRHSPLSQGQGSQGVGVTVDGTVFGNAENIRLRFDTGRLRELSSACSS